MPSTTYPQLINGPPDPPSTSKPPPVLPLHLLPKHIPIPIAIHRHGIHPQPMHIRRDNLDVLMPNPLALAPPCGEPACGPAHRAPARPLARPPLPPPPSPTETRLDKTPPKVGMPAAEPDAEAEEAEGQDAKGDGQRDGDGVAEGTRGGGVGVAAGCAGVGDVPAVVVVVVVVIVVADKVVGVAAGEQIDSWPRDAVAARGDVDLGGLTEEEARLGGSEEVVLVGDEVVGNDVPGESAEPDGDERGGEAFVAEDCLAAAGCGDAEVGLDEDVWGLGRVEEAWVPCYWGGLVSPSELCLPLCGGGGVPSMVRPTCICCPWTGEQKGALKPSKLSHMV
jgi:hypothetical protein